jgi:hypothetical protein
MRPFLLLIPLLPLLGFIFNITVGRRLSTRAASDESPHGHATAAPHPLIGIVAAGSVLLSFLVAARAVLLAHAAKDHAIVETLYTWLRAASPRRRCARRPARCRSASSGPTCSTRCPR